MIPNDVMFKLYLIVWLTCAFPVAKFARLYLEIFKSDP